MSCADDDAAFAQCLNDLPRPIEFRREGYEPHMILRRPIAHKFQIGSAHVRDIVRAAFVRVQERPFEMQSKRKRTAKIFGGTILQNGLRVLNGFLRRCNNRRQKCSDTITRQLRRDTPYRFRMCGEIIAKAAVELQINQAGDDEET